MKKKALALLSAGALTLSLAACSGGSEPKNENSLGGSSLGATPGSDGCTPIVVGTSSEKLNLMDELGQAFKKSAEGKALEDCATVFPINVPSGGGSEILSANPKSWPLKDEAYWPTVWSPASTLWTNRVAAATGNNAFLEAKSFTHTPVVLGMPESMAKALGYPKKPISLKDINKLIEAKDGWASVGKPLWGEFKIAKTNPNTSTTGLSTILMQSYAASGKKKDLTAADVKAAEDFSRSFELGAIHYGDTTGNVLKTLYNNTSGSGSAYVSAIALEETSLYNYNLGNPDSHTLQPGEKLTPPSEKLIAVYPEGGSMWSDNPAVVLPNPWVTDKQKEAGTAFLKFLQSDTAQKILPKYGFRPLDPKVDVSDTLNSSVGIDPTKPTTTLPLPEADVVSAALDQWTTIRKPSAVLELIDVSGSMEEPIGNGKTRLQGAIDGANSTLGHFRGSDQVGLWVFTTGIESSYGKGVYPLRELSPLGGDLERMKDEISDLRPKEGTPLYDAISQAYDYMLKKAEPGRINAIVVLSDGDDQNSTTSLSSLLTKIRSSAKEGSTSSPVRIFTIAYSAEANTSALNEIAQASGGQAFDASNPEKINSVFASVINNF